MLHDQHSYRKIIRKRALFFNIGLALALSFVLVAFEWDTGMPEHDGFHQANNDLVWVIEPPVTILKEEEKKIPPETNKENLIDLNTEFTIDETKEKPKDEKVIEPDFTKISKDGLDEKIIKPDIQDIQFYRNTDVMPEFPGGPEAMYDYIKKNYRIPEWLPGINETIHLEFIVDEQGDIVNIKILRGSVGALNKEAKRVLKGMPAWNPGLQGGHPVKVLYVIPINVQKL